MNVQNWSSGGVLTTTETKLGFITIGGASELHHDLHPNLSLKILGN